ncbi:MITOCHONDRIAL IMPORT RECEPTOR SUBUNIT TOM9-2 [Salix viminalis]|uniref:MITOCHONDRIAL IMPORT RECEPTOR SUBUNIT TOM9-2 n=3 Tax=Salix TaxID=40685 RepID=A0A9Q0NR30_SALVM|nr:MITOCHONDRIAL IMPORT RECEPTOR SUBUNIT TOM9-2 [Salix viminalis]
MASQSRRGGLSLPDRRGSSKQEPNILDKINNSQIVSKGKQAASDTVFVAKKLLKSTGKAAWIAGTTFLILAVPLIIEMDREQQLNELELQQQSLLGAPPVGPAPPKFIISGQIIWINLKLNVGVMTSAEGKPVLGFWFEIIEVALAHGLVNLSVCGYGIPDDFNPPEAVTCLSIRI